MEFNWPGEKLLIKLCDTIAGKGVGLLLKPWQMRREGIAAAEIKRLNSLTLAQTKIEVADIQSGKKVLLPGGKLENAGVTAIDEGVLPTTRLAIIEELEEIVRANMLKEEFRKEVSVTKAVLYAEQELEQDTQDATDVPVSDDWLLRWRDSAAAVSSDELQALWGKVLAGEVKSPGAFSLRTLAFLRNISREDAVLIEKLAPYVIKNFVVRPPKNNELIGDLNFLDFLELQELGILSGVEALGMSTQLRSSVQENFLQGLTSHGRVLLVRHSDVNCILQLPIYIVTRLGQEVLNLGWKRADETYLLKVGEMIKQMGFEVEIGGYVIAGEDKINCVDLKKI